MEAWCFEVENESKEEVETKDILMLFKNWIVHWRRFFSTLV